MATGSLAAVEAIEELREREHGNARAVVDHRHPATGGSRRERDLDPVAGGTLVDGVGEQIDDHLFEEIGVAPNHGAARRRHDPDATLVRASLDAFDRRRDDRLEVDRPQAGRIERRGPRVAKEALTHPLDPPRQAVDPLERPGHLAGGVGVAAFGITLEQDGMNGIDELMGHIGIEARLGLTDVVELVEHGVDRPGDLRHLGVGMGEVDPLIEHAGTDAAGGGRDRGQWGEDAGQRQPSDREHQRHPEDERRQLIEGLFSRRSPQACRRRAGDEHRAIGAGDRRQPPQTVGCRPGSAEARRPGGIPGQAGG